MSDARFWLRAFRPSRLGETDAGEESQTDPERQARVDVYATRAQHGQPLFPPEHLGTSPPAPKQAASG